jgi:hypothetical protein
MDASQSQPGAATGLQPDYVWAPPGSPVTIHLSFEVVDRMNFDVMRGFGAVPRRGAEVGGLLLGTIQSGETTVIHVEDYVAVQCDHLHGPSYLLAEADLARLDEAIGAAVSKPGLRPIGYYRSNTRENLQIYPEDVALLDGRFPEGPIVCLLIKPFATRISEGVFYYRVNGEYGPVEAPVPFPYRRKELGGGSPPRPPRPTSFDLGGVIPPTTYVPPAPPPAAENNSPPRDSAAPEPPLFQWAQNEKEKTVTTEADVAPEEPRSRFRSGWVWIPLSFIFLLLGVVLGFQIALGFRNSQAAAVAADPFSLDLSVVKFGENLHLKWNTAAPVMRTAKRGQLLIQDGENSKTVSLSEEDLARGSALYRHVANIVRFRLEVYPADRISVSESLEFRIPDEAVNTSGGEKTADDSRAAPKGKHPR